MSSPSTHRSSTRLDVAHQYLAVLLALALVVTGLVMALSTPAQAATHQVEGQVFRDFNSNGVRDTNAASTGIASDVGLAGVTVTATDAKGALRGTTVSGADGSYTLDVVNPWSSDVRIEFTGLPAGYESSFHGADNGTSVQFVKVAGAPVTGVNFAVNAPEDYSQGVAPVVTAIHTAGLRGHPDNATKPSLVSVPWSVAQNNGGGYGARTTLALVKDTGSLWGGTFQKSTGDLFASATLRRHADLGPLGLGGIYRVEDALKSDGTINPAAGTVTQWLDVADVAGLNINVGTIPDAATRGLVAPTEPSRDVEAYGKVGKVGIGGIAVSSDSKLLYFVNLFDKKVYAINIADRTLAGSYDLNLAAGERPWALTVHRGKVYVGYAQTGENVSPEPEASDLDIVVRAAPESSLSSLGNNSSEVLRSDLGYTRGDVGGSPAAQFKKWHPWNDVWDAAKYQFVDWPGVSWAQAILSDLQFTTRGELVLGLQDRFALQSGNRNFGPTGSASYFPEGVSLGDILIAGPNGAGGFTMESNGTVSGRTTAAGRANEGPGGKEFFNDSNVFQGGAGTHHENTLGGLSTLAGIDQVASTAFDSTSALRTSGIAWFNATTGSPAKGYQHTNDAASGNFQKAGGLGDIQALANLAPLEIGNRVWFDADQDGVQGADEPGIDGVGVELFAADADGNPTGPALSSTTTSNGGEYYFSVDPNTRYVVVFTPPTSGNWVTDDDRFGTVPWTDLTFTDSTVGGNPAVDSDVNSDGEALVVTGGPGENDHTIDAGLIANTTFTVEKLVDEDGGTPASGQSFTIDVDAKDFRGDPFALTQSSVTLTEDETSVPIEVPVGTFVRLTEPDAADYDSVTVTAPAGATKSGDYYRVQGNSPAFAFRVTNKLFKPGRFEVTKAVTGDFDLDSAELADAEFTVHYEYAGGSDDLILNAANDWKATSPDLPYGATVTLTEPTITGQGASVDFETPSWKVESGPDTATSVQLTIGNDTTQQVALTNPSTELVGGFGLTKAVTGDGADRVPDDFEFVAEYSINGGTSWTELGPVTKDDPDVAGPDDLPVGTKVLIREQAPADLDDVEWVSAVFSGTGVTPATDDDPASFVIAESGPIAVTLTNTTSEINGQFKITKDVTGPGENLLEDGHQFTINWTLGGDPQTPIVLENGEFYTSAPIATGSKIVITEVTPTGGLPAGATWGTPVLRIGGDAEANGSTFTIGDDTAPLEIVLDNPTDVEPEVTITKGDGDAAAGTITHEADTVSAGEYYKAGEKRDIVIRVQNPGPEPLRKVVLTDVTRSGGEIADLKWTFPDGSTVAADWDGATSTWSARWDATFAPGLTEWAVGDVITGTATMTADPSDDVHQNRVRVDAEGAYSGKPVDDTNDYNAFTAAIQVIKYDGNKPDPAIKDDNGDWIIPGKPLADPNQDANDADHSVKYVADKSNKVRWVVTNTGPTWLTRITLADVTGAGPDIGDDWTANLSAFGGPADYSFVKDGPWNGLLPPGASFFARGTLTLPADTVHHDTITVTGVPVVPATGDDGAPSDQPLLDGDNPVVVLDENGDPVVLTDDDPFHAHTPAPAIAPEDEKGQSPEDEEAAPEDNGLLPDAGSGLGIWAPLGGLLLLLSGAGVVIGSKRRRENVSGRHRV